MMSSVVRSKHEWTVLSDEDVSIVALHFLPPDWLPSTIPLNQSGQSSSRQVLPYFPHRRAMERQHKKAAATAGSGFHRRTKVELARYSYYRLDESDPPYYDTAVDPFVVTLRRANIQLMSRKILLRAMLRCFRCFFFLLSCTSHKGEPGVAQRLECVRVNGTKCPVSSSSPVSVRMRDVYAGPLHETYEWMRV